MVPADLMTPFVQVGREIRIELTMVLGASRIGQLAQGACSSNARISDQRPDDVRTIDRRKAEALLRSVHAGAVRR